MAELETCVECGARGVNAGICPNAVNHVNRPAPIAPAPAEDVEPPTPTPVEAPTEDPSEDVTAAVEEAPVEAPKKRSKK